MDMLNVIYTILTLVIAYIFYQIKKGGEMGMDYRPVLGLGALWFIVGLAVGNPGLWFAGIMFGLLSTSIRRRFKGKAILTPKKQPWFYLALGLTALLAIIILVG